MKTKIISLALFGSILALTLSSCRTTQNADGSTSTQIDPQRTADVIRAVVPPAVRLAVAKQPESRKWIQDAKIAICSAANAGNITPDDLKAAVNSTGINEIKTPEVEAAIESIYGIYSAYYGDVVAKKLEKITYLAPVLNSICDSLTEGLATSP